MYITYWLTVRTARERIWIFFTSRLHLIALKQIYKHPNYFTFSLRSLLESAHTSWIRTLNWIQDRLALLGVLTRCEELLDCLVFLHALFVRKRVVVWKHPCPLRLRPTTLRSTFWIVSLHSKVPTLLLCSAGNFFKWFFNSFRYRANSSASPALLQCLHTQALWLCGFPFFPT